MTLSEPAYVEVTPELLAAWACVRAATEVEAALAGELYRWAFAITDLHQALTAALVATLSGTHQTGALERRDQAKWLAWLNREPNAELPKEEERVARFKTLLERAISGEYDADLRGSVSVSEQEKSDILLLDRFRNHLDHVKPRFWKIQTAGLPRITAASADLLHQLFHLPAFWLHLDEAHLQQARSTAEWMRTAEVQKPRQR